MPSIVAYRKITDAYTTHDARLPAGGQELCTLDGITYAAIPAGAALPAQPSGIDVSAPKINAQLRRRIAASSPVATAAQRRADNDVAEGIKTRAEADAELAAKLSGFGLLLTALDDLKTERIAAINDECRARILAVWPMEKQVSATLGIYGDAELAAMTDFIDAHIAASNTATSAVFDATTQAAMEAVTVTWPV